MPRGTRMGLDSHWPMAKRSGWQKGLDSHWPRGLPRGLLKVMPKGLRLAKQKARLTDSRMGLLTDFLRAKGLQKGFHLAMQTVTAKATQKATGFRLRSEKEKEMHLDLAIRKRSVIQKDSQTVTVIQKPTDWPMGLPKGWRSELPKEKATRWH
jgi:hypothetical protein